MPNSPRYVLDANVFIEAARRYYAFDIAPAFWRALVEHAEDGRLLSIDRVKDEIERGNDELRTWAKGDFQQYFLSTNEDGVISEYRRVITWVHDESQFSDASKAEFANGADGWLIAYAMEKVCLVVTHEQFDPAIRRKVPIPNVCRQFSVQYVDTFQMLRDLGVRLA